MPIEPILDHPLAMTLGAAAFGALTRLCFHFYASECRELPKGDYELRLIARAHGPTWRANCNEILQVFQDVRPALEQFHRQRDARENVINFARVRAAWATNSKRKAQALQTQSPPQTLTPTAPTREPTTPAHRQPATRPPNPSAIADRA